LVSINPAPANSAVAIVAGTLLPYLAARDRRLLKPTTEKTASQIDEHDPDEEEDAEMDKIREMVREWKAEAARHGRPLRLPTSRFYFGTALTTVPFMLRNIWTAGLVLFGLIMGSTFFITKVWQVSDAADT
jgi:solute carrier family 45 protein 1/2/4